MTMNITALICLGYAVIYILCANGCGAIVTTCRNFAKRNDVDARSVISNVMEDAIKVKYSSIFRGSVISTDQGIILRTASHAEMLSS